MNILLTVTGPSGSGKSTLVRELTQKYGVHKLVTCTTREPRPKEKDGVDYYFMSLEKFYSHYMLAPTEFAGNHYGIDRDKAVKEIRSNNISVIILDPYGANVIKNSLAERKDIVVKSMFVDIPPKVALARMGRRDGWRKAKERQAADMRSGMYLKPFELPQIYDCVLKSDHVTPQKLAYEAACYLKAIETEVSLVA